MNNTLEFIGHISTPYQQLEECPSNVSRNGPECQVILDDHYVEGLRGFKVGDNILVLYWLDQADRNLLLQRNVHKNDGEPVGTFTLRSPFRPNPIGIAVVTIEHINDGQLTVKGMDCLNGTRLLDIKPA